MLETTTELPSVNMFKHSNNKDGREIQQAKPPINQMVRLQKQVTTTFCNISVKLVPPEKLENVHPLVKETFPEELKQNVPLGVRISHFEQSWKKLTKDQEILEIVKGYKIPLLRTPVQEKIPLNKPLIENRKFLVEKEIKKMLEKGAIKKVSQHKYQHAQNQFLSNLFLVRKKMEVTVHL